MKKRFSLVLVFMALQWASAAQVFVLDRDNGASFYSSSRNQYEGCEDGLVQVLTQLGHQVTLGSSLPESLSNYEILFVTLGFYCPS